MLVAFYLLEFCFSASLVQSVIVVHFACFRVSYLHTLLQFDYQLTQLQAFLCFVCLFRSFLGCNLSFNLLTCFLASLLALLLFACFLSYFLTCNHSCNFLACFLAFLLDRWHNSEHCYSLLTCFVLFLYYVCLHSCLFGCRQSCKYAALLCCVRTCLFLCFCFPSCKCSCDISACLHVFSLQNS